MQSDRASLRPGSAILTGVVADIAVLTLLVPALLTDDRNWALIGWLVLALILLWLFVMRPKVVIHDEGLRIVNPMRTTEITWPMITGVRSRWVLEVLHEHDRYPAWGVPTETERPRRGRGAFSPGVAKPARDSKPAPAKITAQAVAAEVQARCGDDRRRKDGRTAQILSRTWDPASVALLLAGLAFWAIAFFVV